ncbi:hypothetical protein Cgig2_003502 [Carnegiea gigantea]|uniref:Uncharacterized protein n=1 Tax=Carnegiea gigantea TaxID=171969 RepID=A0A9Q1KC65_9CARY|nr:hypothetical protein Cgig2_003502 [Carnegiea gigantea]
MNIAPFATTTTPQIHPHKLILQFPNPRPLPRRQLRSSNGTQIGTHHIKTNRSITCPVIRRCSRVVEIDVADRIAVMRRCCANNRIRVRVLIVIIQFHSSTVIHRRITPDFPGNLKCSLIMRTLEHKLLTRTHFAKNIPVLLLQPPQFLHQLILIEIQLKLRLNLIIERRRIMVMSRRPTGRSIIKKPLEKLDLILIGPQPLKEPSRIIDRLLLRRNNRRHVLPFRIRKGDGDGGARGGDAGRNCDCHRRRRIRVAVVSLRRGLRIAGDGIVIVGNSAVQGLTVVVVIVEVVVVVDGGVLLGGHSTIREGERRERMRKIGGYITSHSLRPGKKDPLERERENNGSLGFHSPFSPQRSWVCAVLIQLFVMYTRKKKKKPPDLPRLLSSFSIYPSSCRTLPFACFAASKPLIGSFSLGLCDSLQLPTQSCRCLVPFTVQVREFDASHTLYFLVDKIVRVRVSRVLALLNHCYKIVDDSSSELTFGVRAYGAT